MEEEEEEEGGGGGEEEEEYRWIIDENAVVYFGKYIPEFRKKILLKK